MLFDATVGGKRARLECGPRLTVGDLISIPAALVLDAALDGTTLTIPVSYTHLTLPTNREV